eukprot:GILK01006974.1.p1 GENE.GILK01006974.1~~GILK01006974.1.p1  ORF type:complete len:344 (+),score=46.13 GILK01006974.1:86-1117(+)
MPATLIRQDNSSSCSAASAHIVSQSLAAVSEAVNSTSSSSTVADVVDLLSGEVRSTASDLIQSAVAASPSSLGHASVCSSSPKRETPPTGKVSLLALLNGSKRKAEDVVIIDEPDTKHPKLVGDELPVGSSAIQRPAWLDDVSEELMCCICQELIVLAHALPCSHSFCKSCITTWLANKQPHNQTCPGCRAKVTSPPIPVKTLDNAIDLLAKQLLSKVEQKERAEKIKNAQQHKPPVATVPPAFNAAFLLGSGSFVRPPSVLPAVRAMPTVPAAAAAASVSIRPVPAGGAVPMIDLTRPWMSNMFPGGYTGMSMQRPWNPPGSVIDITGAPNGPARGRRRRGR